MTPESEYFLETERLGLRCWSLDDLDRARALWGDPRVTRLIDARGPLTDDAVRELLEQQLLHQREHGVQYWPMFLRTDGTHVGCCGLRPRDVERRVYELGFHVCADHWRRGYALEAARAVVDFAFGRLGAAALFAGHHPDNDASRRLLERLGFRHSHDELYAPTGLEHPSYVLERSSDVGGGGTSASR